ncbi:MAG TPA: hypothetical protein VJU86_04310 [Pyrinomonadaceae bacterium]|nr:hypothetical protein [Pyrinomonadaceae bacterium]
MKTIALASMFTLVLLSLSTNWSTSARVSGPSANGTYRFALEDGLTKQIEFDARLDERGTATGQLTFTDDAAVVDQDPDSVPEKTEDPPAQFTITADLDTLTIENNRALMGGVVRNSSHRSYIGRLVLLVVEDNPTGGEVPDKLTWRICQPEATGWTPSDAEDPRDEGASFQWWATDAEREDDRGVQSTSVMPGVRRGCPTYPIASYRFPVIRGEGQIQVQQ